MSDWVLRLIKGMFIGSGAILPGVSGGALAAVFGLYEKMISFLANIRKDFKKNVLYFIPVGIGGLLGIFLLSFALSYFFEKSESQLVWFFIGCILGTLPALFKQAAKKGRKPRHIITMIITAIIAYLFLRNAQSLINGSLELNTGTWVLAGAIFGLGLIIPGLSPSNFLVYLNLYKAMTDGIKDLDFSIIIPLGIGAIAVIILFSKLMNYLFNKVYAGLFHLILGVVIASTVMIIPQNFDYLSLGALVCAVVCVLGVLLGLWMSRLEDKYKPE